ncbi:MAG: LptF/LptG family permease, partial [Nitrospinota bacterium]|nr:LptF/LptG family permease [Nitrospinota bacterium]
FYVFLVGITIVMSILFLEKIHFLSELILDSEISLMDFVYLLGYVTPAFLVVSIPMAIHLATLITFSQLSADNEITAMRSCGVSFIRILLPVIIFSTMIFSADYYLSVNVQHEGNYKFIKLLRKIITERISLSLTERVFFDKIKNTVIYVSEKPVDADTLEGLFIFDSHNPEKPEFITASKGRFVTVDDQVILQLSNGSVYSGDSNTFRMTKYVDYEMVFNTDPDKKDGYVIQPREMSIEEIRTRVEDRKKKNEPHTNDEVEIYKRRALPFTCIVLALLGVPLGIRSQRGGKWSGISLGIGAIITNYILLMLFEGLGREGKVDPALSMWIPNIIVGAFTIYLISVTSREVAPFRFFGWFEQLRIAFIRFSRKKDIASEENGKK